MLILNCDNVEYTCLAHGSSLPVLSKFSRSTSYNRDRQERQSCLKRSQKGQEESLTMNAAFPEVETYGEDENREEEDKGKHHSENPRGVAFPQDGGGVVQQLREHLTEN